MHNYESATRRFPAAEVNLGQGKRGLSWRVLLLNQYDPDLFKEFKFDEPWDSPHNKKLIPRMPEEYKLRGGRAAEQFKTNFLLVRGEKTMYPPGQMQGPTDGSISDGMAKTIMILEVDDAHAVIWTKPDDYILDKKNPKAGFRSGGSHAAFGDGAVRMIEESIDSKVLNALFTASGGEAKEIEEFFQ